MYIFVLLTTHLLSGVIRHSS